MPCPPLPPSGLAGTLLAAPAQAAPTSFQTFDPTAQTVALDQSTPMRATLRRTEGGVAHITSSTWAGAGFGYAYGLAQDNVCVLADTYVTVNAER